jgi:hypothetical protein
MTLLFSKNVRMRMVLRGVLREVIETARQIEGHSAYGHLWPSFSHEADTDLPQNGCRVCIIKDRLSTRTEIESGSQDGRLDSWKEISAYFKRSVRTVRRWEAQEGLPVHRLGHQTGRSVYAYKTELDAWWESRKVQDEPPEVPQEESPPPFSESLMEGQDSTVRPDGTALPAVSAARPVHTRFWMWLLVPVAVVLAAIYGVQHIPSRAAGSLTVTPLTTYPGNEVQPSLSPDGNHVAFAFNGGRTWNYDIYVKVIGSEEITRLTSDPADDLSPSWSPDGQNIVFLRFVSVELCTRTERRQPA